MSQEAPEFEYGFNLTDVTCGLCGGWFKVEEDWLANKKRSGQKFRCPYCCREIFYILPPPPEKPAPAPWWRFW